MCLLWNWRQGSLQHQSWAVPWHRAQGARTSALALESLHPRPHPRQRRHPQTLRFQSFLLFLLNPAFKTKQTFVSLWATAEVACNTPTSSDLLLESAMGRKPGQFSNWLNIWPIPSQCQSNKTSWMLSFPLLPFSLFLFELSFPLVDVTSSLTTRSAASHCSLLFAG